MLSTVHVLVTTVEGTRAAIAAAIPVARKRRAPVVLLAERDDWQTARCLRAAHETDPTITAKCLVGSNTTEAIKELVPVLALIVVGGPTRRWWPTRHERLAARLQRHGRDVRFVGCRLDREPPTDAPAASIGTMNERPLAGAAVSDFQPRAECTAFETVVRSGARHSSEPRRTTAPTDT